MNKARQRSYSYWYWWLILLYWAYLVLLSSCVSNKVMTSGQREARQKEDRGDRVVCLTMVGLFFVFSYVASQKPLQQ